MTLLERAFALAVAGAAGAALAAPGGRTCRPGRLDDPGLALLGLNAVALAFRALVALDAAVTARAAGWPARSGQRLDAPPLAPAAGVCGARRRAVTLVAGPHLAVAGAAAIARPLFVQLLPVARCRRPGQQRCRGARPGPAGAAGAARAAGAGR